MRYQTAFEIRDELQSAKAGLLNQVGGRSTPPRNAFKTFFKRRAATMSGSVLLLVMIAAALRIIQRQPPSLPEVKQRQLTANSSENAVAGQYRIGYS